MPAYAFLRTGQWSVMPSSTRFVLIQPSHAGNVGAAARAIKVMGFDDLVLVSPRWSDVLEREETIERASGAVDLLRKARVVASVDEAVEGMTHVLATVMTPRDFGPPTRAPREHLQAIAPEGHGVAFLFGSERYGMRNEDVYRCHAALRIPMPPPSPACCSTGRRRWWPSASSTPRRPRS